MKVLRKLSVLKHKLKGLQAWMDFIRQIKTARRSRQVVTMENLREKLDVLQNLRTQEQVSFLLNGKQDMPASETSEQIIDFFIQCLKDPVEYSRALALCNSIYYMLLQAPQEKLIIVIDILIGGLLKASLNPLETENCCNAIKVVCSISKKRPLLFERSHGQILIHVACNLEPNVVGLITFHIINRTLIECLFKRGILVKAITYHFLERAQFYKQKTSYNQFLLEYMDSFFELVMHNPSICQSFLVYQVPERWKFRQLLFHRKRQIRESCLLTLHHMHRFGRLVEEGASFFNFAKRFLYLPTISGMLSVRYYFMQQLKDFDFTRVLRQIMVHKGFSFSQKKPLFKLTNRFRHSQELDEGKVMFMAELLSKDKMPISIMTSAVVPFFNILNISDKEVVYPNIVENFFNCLVEHGVIELTQKEPNWRKFNQDPFSSPFRQIFAIPD